LGKSTHLIFNILKTYNFIFIISIIVAFSEHQLIKVKKMG